MIHLHQNVEQSWPGARFGVLVLRGFAPQPGTGEAFARQAEAELEALRSRHRDYDRKRFCQSDGVMAAYTKYYKKFKKSYFVLLQLESILRGKGIPEAPPLVQALFLTELQSGMLLAGHDLQGLFPPLSIECAQGGERCSVAGTGEVSLKAGDIAMRDERGFFLSMIYGQAERTRITPGTSDVFFLVDGVPGLDGACYEKTLERLLSNVRLFQPDAQPERMEILPGLSAAPPLFRGP